MTPPEVYVRRTDRQTIGDLSKWSKLVVVQRWNDVGRWTLQTSNPDEAALLTPVVNSSGVPTEPRGVIIRRDAITLVSGWCETLPQITVSGSEKVWTFSGWDDTFILANTLCWPKPSSAITSQTDVDHVVSGPRSNRIRDLFIANVADRVGIPGVIGGSQLNLGASGTSRARMKNLLEMAQLIAAEEVNFRVIQRDSDNALFLQQSLPRDLTRDVQFSPSVGTVAGWSFTPAAAVATRVVIGAGDEGANRKFRQYINADAEAEWAGVRKIEQFKDRRDLNPSTNPTWESEAAADAADFLAENAPRASFSMTVTGGPTYGTRWLVGDKVRAYVDADVDGVPTFPVDDLAKQATVTWDGTGESVEVHIGPEDTPEMQTARRYRDLLRRIKSLEANR